MNGFLPKEATLFIYHYELDAHTAAKGLRTTPNRLLMRWRANVRELTWAVREHIATICGVTLFEENHQGSNGYLNGNKKAHVCIRCFNSRRGVKFQSSSNMGKGRHCTEDDLLDHLGSPRTHYIIGDVTNVPVIKIIQLPMTALRQAVRTGELDTDGWSGREFYGWVNRTFEIIQYDADRMLR